MADDIDTVDTTKPPATLDQKEQALENPPADELFIPFHGYRGDAYRESEVVAGEPETASTRIRAFEDEHLGAEAVRINDKIERGSGSPFAALSDEHKRQYAALEKLVAAEQKLADAHAALIQADVEHEAALAAAEPAPDAK